MGPSIRERLNSGSLIQRRRSSELGTVLPRSVQRKLLFVVLFSIGPYVADAYAATEAVSPRSELASAIDIKIETSRSQPTVGSGLGIVAEIQNVSNAPVYLREKGVILALPPELQGPFAATSALWGMFPTVHTFTPSGQVDPFDGVLTLKPGAIYRAFWSSTPTASSDPAPQGRLAFVGNMVSVVTSELNFIFFTPGDYKVSVVAAYWSKPEFPEKDYRTMTQTATIRVAAPQTVILFGAGLGGLIAYFIIRFRRPRGADDTLSRVRMLLREATGIAGAILLSAMVTILLARISETQFLIRITVNDFWGAIAIGFIATWIGNKVIEKFLPDAPGDSPGRESIVSVESSDPGHRG
jgi:hypothetical protein